MVKPGYKETEVGVIPEEWDIYPLKSISDVKTGPFGSALHAEDYVQSGTPIITVEHLGENSITRQNLPMVSEQDVKKLSAYILRVGDIVFSRVGSVDRNAYVTDDENGWLFSGRLLRIRPKFSELYSKYLGYYFKFDSVKNRIKEIAVGQTMASLNTKLMNTFLVTLPPVEEQEKIAEALSDMDELIASLEKLIAKKKAIKQGAMQELLTGKKRLPGFDGEWEEVKIGNRGGLTKTSINPQDHSNELFTEYSMPAFDDGRSPVVTKGAAMHSSRTVIDGEVLLFNKLNVRQRRIWHISKCEHNAVCSSEFLAYKSTDLDLQLLSQILNTDKVTDDFINMSTGTSNSQRRITPANFMDYIVKIPVDKVEQQALASILSDMDAEIDALEQKLAKCRQTKQGMMQQLLTGKIRLI